LQTSRAMPSQTDGFSIIFRIDRVGEEWRVTMNGEHAIAFVGPDAEVRAEDCARELRLRLLIAAEMRSAQVH